MEVLGGFKRGLSIRLLIDEFLKKKPLAYKDGRFYGVNGRVTSEDLKREIANVIKDKTDGAIASYVNSVFNDLPYYTAKLREAKEDEIYLANGVLLYTAGRFSNEMFPVPYRLNACYKPDLERDEEGNVILPAPLKTFFSQLFYDEDLAFIQQYLGYLLIPTRRGHVMLFILGWHGNEGKSVFASLVQDVFGVAMKPVKLPKLLSHTKESKDRLVVVDEDTDTKLLQTGTFKSFVTKMLGDEDDENLKLYSRLICIANAFPISKDVSGGFSRRIVPITVKPPKHKIDRYLADKLSGPEYRDYLFAWAFEGLQVLLANDFEFTISQRAKATLRDNLGNQCSVRAWLDAEDGDVYFNEKAAESSSQLFYIYKNWCEANSIAPLTLRKFSLRMKDLADEYGFEYSADLGSLLGDRCRGFKGITTQPFLRCS